MTTTVRRRSVIFAGLFLLSLLALAAGSSLSHAMTPAGAGVGGSDVSFAPLTQAQAQTAVLRHGVLDSRHAAVAPAATVTVASAGGVSTTTWIVLVVALAALAIVVWALLRSRRRSRFAAPADAFCSLHPQDARCMAG